MKYSNLFYLLAESLTTVNFIFALQGQKVKFWSYISALSCQGNSLNLAVISHPFSLPINGKDCGWLFLFAWMLEL